MATSRRDPPGFEQLVGGVRALRPAARRVPPPADSGASVPLKEAAAPPPITVETVDEVVLARAEDAPIRWLEELQYGPLPPSRELDLHGLSAAKAEAALRVAVPKARADRMRSLVVICGRGTRSGPGGPVLPRLVVDALSVDLARHVLAFRSAPAKFGGSGAIIVRLRKPG